MPRRTDKPARSRFGCNRSFHTGHAVVGGLLALAAAALGAVMTTLNASQRANQAGAYLEIQTAARQAREIDLPDRDLDEARANLAEISARRDEQNKTADVINARAYRKAKKNIVVGGQSYAVDQGLSHQPGGDDAENG